MKTIKVVLICAVFLAAAGPLSAGDAPSAGPAAAAALSAAERSSGAAGSSAAAPASGLVPGYRGAVIPLSGDQLIYVKRGDHVDVLVTFEAVLGKKGETTKEKVTATILQNVLVLNVRQPENKDVPGALELMCDPVEAQYAALSVAQAIKINIAVRAPGDTQMHPMEMASFRKLIQ